MKSITIQQNTINKVLEPSVGCIAGAMEIIGNKWTALILRDLAGGSQRFCLLERALATSTHEHFPSASTI